MDGVGGWIGRLVDTGKLTKEMAGLITARQAQGKYSSLTDLFQRCISEAKSNGSTTCVMGELEDKITQIGGKDTVTLNTINLGDSGYALIRKKAHATPSAPEYETIF